MCEFNQSSYLFVSNFIFTDVRKTCSSYSCNQSDKSNDKTHYAQSQCLIMHKPLLLSILSASCFLLQSIQTVFCSNNTLFSGKCVPFSCGYTTFSNNFIVLQKKTTNQETSRSKVVFKGQGNK